MPLHQTPPAPPERVKISKKRIVSSTIKVAPRVQPTTGVNTYYHSGNLGDVIYGLFAIKKAGGGRFLVGPEQHRTSPCDKPITQGSYDLLLPLLKHQSYLTESAFAPHYHPTGVKDLNVFRNHWNNAQIRASTGISLLSEMHFYALGLQNRFSLS